MKPIYIAVALGLAAIGFGSAYALTIGPAHLPTFGISLPK